MTTPTWTTTTLNSSTRSAALQVTELVVTYANKRAVDGLTLTVPTGSIYGFLGPNGAGKTTTIKTLLGFRRAHSGSAQVLGLDIGRSSTEIRSRVGYVCELGGLYDHLSADQMGQFFGSTTRHWQQPTFERLVHGFGLARQKKIGALSRGTKMQLAFALAMGGNPDLLILDEPTAGLDPVARRDLLSTLVTEVAASGKTVFFSSHNLTEVEAVADWVGILRAGRLALSGELDDLKQRHKVLKLTYEGATAPAHLTALRALVGVTRLEQDGRTLRLNVRGDVPEVIRAVQAMNAGLRDLTVLDQNLEDLFLALMKEDSA